MIFRMAPEANIRDAGYAVRGTLRYRHRGRVFVQAVCSTEPFSRKQEIDILCVVVVDSVEGVSGAARRFSCSDLVRSAKQRSCSE